MPKTFNFVFNKKKKKGKIQNTFLRFGLIPGTTKTFFKISNLLHNKKQYLIPFESFILF